MNSFCQSNAAVGQGASSEDVVTSLDGPVTGDALSPPYWAGHGGHPWNGPIPQHQGVLRAVLLRPDSPSHVPAGGSAAAGPGRHQGHSRIVVPRAGGPEPDFPRGCPWGAPLGRGSEVVACRAEFLPTLAAPRGGFAPPVDEGLCRPPRDRGR